MADLIDELLALHRPWYKTRPDGDRIDHVVLVMSEDLDDTHVCRVGVDSCTPADDEHYALACVECRWSDEDGNPAFPLWPCPTARLALLARGGTEWCAASGSHDEYVHDDRSDTIRCSLCSRDLYLTKHLTLPKHLSTDPRLSTASQLQAGDHLPSAQSEPESSSDPANLTVEKGGSDER